MLEIRSLNKTYGSKKALDNVSLTLNPGVYGLLGPNGAGKSTLMNIITGNLSADSGEVLYNGKNVESLGRDYRAVLGFMPQQQGLYDNFTGHRFLSYIAGLKGMDKRKAETEIERALSLVNLTEQKGKKLGAYSGGLKQRILIAQAILNDPEIIILDEPTAGLDPRERIRVRNIISEIAINKTVILATHVVSDIEQIGKEVILIKNGRIIGKGEPRVFLDAMYGRVFELEIEPYMLREIEANYLVSNIAYYGDRLLVNVVTDYEPFQYYHKPVYPTLEEVYLYMFSDEVR